MHNIIKNIKSENIKEYTYNNKFTPYTKIDSKHTNTQKDGDLHSGDTNDVDDEVKKILDLANDKAASILEEANLKAISFSEQIKKEALEEAEIIRQTAYEKGYDDGLQDGYIASKTENDIEFKNQVNEVLENLAKEIKCIEEMKDKITKMHYSELTELAVNIASKVINVSLKSSSDVIEKMIIAATEKSKNAQWVKIYIAECDSEYVLKSDNSIVKQLRHITDTVKIEILENKDSGTCIVEFPDQIIDASVNTQLDNIKDVLYGN